MALTIASLNIWGSGDNTKRREMFTCLHVKDFSMYMLQEVHCTENTNPIWSADWGYQAIFNNKKSKKAGVCIYFSKTTLIFKLKRSSSTPKDALLLICNIKTNKTCLTFANRYAPNEDNPAFFFDLFDHLTGEENIGNYNLVLDQDKDKRGGLAKLTK